MEKLNNWLKKIQYFLFPATCVLCSAKGLEHLDLCESCYDEIKPIKYLCNCCAEPLEDASACLCGHCLKARPNFEQVFACTLYQNEAKRLVNLLKHREHLAVSNVIGQLLFFYWQQYVSCNVDAVTYVPSHQLRKRQRGFNQSYLIAKHFCRLSGKPLAKSLLTRVKWSANQVGLSRKKRMSNIKNAFKVQTSQLPKRILLIDDVVTTASTVNEVARVLKKAGAIEVYVLTFARTAK